MLAISWLETAATCTMKEVAGGALPVAGCGLGATGLSPTIIASLGVAALFEVDDRTIGTMVGASDTSAAFVAVATGWPAVLPAVGLAEPRLAVDVGWNGTPADWADLRPMPQ